MICDFLTQALDRVDIRKSPPLGSELGQRFPELRHLSDDFYHVASDPLFDYEALQVPLVDRILENV